MVWYYVKDGARQGPVEEAELNSLVGEGVVRPDTLVWSEGMADWRPYASVAPAPIAETAPPPAVEPVQPHIEARQAYAAEPALEPEPAPEVVPQAVPESAYVSAAAPVAAATAAAVQAHYCTQCGRQYPSEELVRFGTATVCANCKEIYAQRLRETGQVAGARVYGGFWIRFLAVFIDGILLGIVNFALQAVTSTRIITGSDVGNLGLLLSTLGFNFMISITLNMFYESFFLVQYGATPGKMIFKLKVITAEGGRLTWGRAIGRFFAKFLSGITLLIGYIMAAFDSEKRALHDYIAGTRVIRTA
jgi:uncharacterized RDD family membrane protein YckC